MLFQPEHLSPNDGATGATSHYRMLDGVCTVTNTTARIYQLSAPLPLVTGAMTVLDTGRRIEATELRFEDSVAPFDQLYDRTLGVDCSPAEQGDGTVRCFPVPGRYTALYFTDAACSSPIELGFEVCGPARAPGLVASSSGQLHQLGAAYSGPLYSMAPACMPAPNATPSYTLGPVVTTPPAIGTLVVDP